MKVWQNEDIIRFLKMKTEPINDPLYGPGYPASVYLLDGTFLPCVIFRNPDAVVNLAIRRFQEEKSGEGVLGGSAETAYTQIVTNFVTKGNRVNDYEVDRIETCPFAIPAVIQQQLSSETAPGWRCFAVRMSDGKYIGFGTGFGTEFFNLPEGYAAQDMIEVINHVYVLNTGELLPYSEAEPARHNEYQLAVTCRERSFFECFVADL
jgi:hypothetical protein